VWPRRFDDRLEWFLFESLILLAKAGYPMFFRGFAMKMKHLLTAAAWLALSGLAQAQIDPLQARSLAASCAACHGTDGRALPAMISLAGSNKDDMVRKMLDYKADRVPAATIMHQLAKGYTDEQIAAIAGYFAAQKR
jgi:cytochrome c553